MPSSPFRRPPFRPLVLSLALSLLPWAAQAQGTSDSAPAAKPPSPAPQRRPAPQRPPTASPEQLDRVQIQGGPSDTVQRRASTASKIIIGREELDRFGDPSVADTLKRLPGVTLGGRPGRGGGVRMRGMGGGYTQILVNGERMPPSFSLEELPPDQIERIEVMRAPTAEYGARAVAGTINIVLREALQKKLNDVALALAGERGVVSPQFSWTRNDKLDDEGSAYSLSVNAGESKRRDDADSLATTRRLSDGLILNEQRNTGQSEDDRRRVNLNARIQWRLAGGDTLTLMPMLAAAKGTSSSLRRQDASNGMLHYDTAQTRNDSDFSLLRLNSTLNRRLGEDTRLELRGAIGRADMDSESLRREWLKNEPLPDQLEASRNRDRSWNLGAKLSHLMAEEHSLVAGLEAEGNRRSQTRRSLMDGMRVMALEEFGDEFEASSLRLAAYAQDEWKHNANWSAYAGLRWEGIRTESDARNYNVKNDSSVWTPLLHAVWKPDEKSRDQVRMSLTRSYRSPNTQDLIARPVINAQFPGGANEPNYADRVGNPDLKPEMATGIDLALERYLSKGGVLSVSVFARRIKDLIRTTTTLETVSWSTEPRWVARPSNIGKAVTRGIELEAKFRLDEFIEDALPVSLRSNISFFRSKVDGIPGPNNTLDQQPRYTANLGADYRLRSLPLTLGASVNWVPATTIQQTLIQSSSVPRRQVIDAFALWNINRSTALRLSGGNLVPLDYDTGSVITTADKSITSENYGRTFMNWQLRLEIKL
ncbi:TonB-dependent receptor [Paucibacter sp. O1-1]|nr:TonB-dependent receptor [Paucibacter sp. O1-1]MDA3826841.1 TonB-dependent receptor [Paucibacter sp. O1-1]